MSLITFREAAKLPYMPSTAFFYTVKDSENPPGYFVKDKRGWKIDTEHQDWEDYIDQRRNKFRVEQEREEAGYKIELEDRKKISIEDDPEILELRKEAVKARIKEPIMKAQKLEYENELKRIAIKKDLGELIEYNLAEFIFFGYMDKTAREMLMMTKKIEPILANLVKEKDVKGIVNLINREHENIIIEIKKAQKKDLTEWMKDVDRK